jgi:hypothetical protein
MPEPAHRTRPVQVAKRKQKPLGQEEPVVKKKSKTTKATTEGDEASNASDEQDEPKTFISPEKYLDKAIVREDDEEPRVFVSPLQYMYLANEHDERPRVGRKSHEKGQVDKESSTRPSSNKPSSSQPPPHVEKSTEPSVDRFVTDAQEELMRMIDDRASDKAIEYQMKIIKMFRARLPSQGRSTFLLYLTKLANSQKR